VVAPGTALREGIDNIVHASTGALVVVGFVVGSFFSSAIRFAAKAIPTASSSAAAIFFIGSLPETLSYPTRPQ